MDTCRMIAIRPRFSRQVFFRFLYTARPHCLLYGTCLLFTPQFLLALNVPSNRDGQAELTCIDLQVNLPDEASPEDRIIAIFIIASSFNIFTLIHGSI